MGLPKYVAARHRCGRGMGGFSCRYLFVVAATGAVAASQDGEIIALFFKNCYTRQRPIGIAPIQGDRTLVLGALEIRRNHTIEWFIFHMLLS